MNNPITMLTNKLQTQLRTNSPQAFSQYEQLRKNNGNPQELLNQITHDYTPERTQQFIQFANSFGITNEQLQQFGINAK